MVYTRQQCMAISTGEMIAQLLNHDKPRIFNGGKRVPYICLDEFMLDFKTLDLDICVVQEENSLDRNDKRQLQVFISFSKV